jgi:hypothetical protein
VSFLLAIAVFLSAVRAGPEMVNKTRMNKGEIARKRHSVDFIFLWNRIR